MNDQSTGEPLLEVRDLRVTYRTRDSEIPAARGVTFDVHPGEILAIVGESASGKSTVGHAILDLLPVGTSEMAGTVRWRGRDLSTMSEDEMRRLRGREVAVIFQDALAALTPTMTVGEQLAEVFKVHLEVGVDEARRRAREALLNVMPNADRVLDTHPFQLSGGMAQRVMIAMATALQPKMLIADEPTANLDPAVRQETLEWLERIRDAGGAVLLITHDFGVVARLADRVAVMYAGQLVETADVRTAFRSPKHPYTYGLLQSLPSFAEGGRLQAMPGQPPDLSTLPPECPFLPRCNKAIATCRTSPAPPLLDMEDAPGHLAACFNPMAVGLRD
ncbi:MAG: ABC transporter ATP-binding protein [Dehalococcoidia bacterium]